MATPTLERRLAAVWFVDIVDFTRLSASDEPMAYRVMEAMRLSVRQSVEAHGGVLVKFLGDGALAHFPSAEAAVEAALQVHCCFRAAARLLPGPHKLRVGVHLGEVAVGPDGDLFGDGVNRAARLQDMAQPGQVLVSQAVRELLRQRPEMVFVSRGRRTAKGLDEPIHVFEAEARGGLADRLEAVERTTDPVSPGGGRRRRRLASHPRAIGTGIAAGVIAFVGLGIYTAWGGTPPSGPVVDAAAPVSVMVPVLDSAPGEGPLPRWPAMAAATPVEVESPPLPVPPTPAQELRAMARTVNARLRAIPTDASGWHETLPLLRRGVDEALAGTPSGARLDLLSGLLLFLQMWDFEGAEAAFQRALELDPSVSARRLYAQLLTALGRTGEALYQLQRAEEAGLDEVELHIHRGATLLRAGRPDEAEDELREAVDARPGVLAPRLLLARALVARGEPDDAAQLLAEGAPSVPAALWRAYAGLRQNGAGEEGTRTRLPGLVRAGEGLPETSYLLAMLMAAAGQEERAFAYLDRAIEARSPSVVWLAVDPEWGDLKDDPRYYERLRRVGLLP